MKISVLQENLAKGLAIVSRAAASRSTTLPVRGMPGVDRREAVEIATRALQ